MALSADQSAVLELLLAGQSYADLAALLDLDEAEVRRRARAALTELGGADPDRNVGLTDYLLGQADPIGRADAVRHLRRDAADHELAASISDQLAAMAPGADLPKLPQGRAGGRFLSREPGGAAEPAERRSPLASIPHERGRFYAILGAAGVILVVVVLAVAGVFSGEEESPAAEEPTAQTGSNGDDPAEGIGEIPTGEEISRVPLAPTGGGDAAGAAIVGLSTGDQPYLDLIVENLEPAPQGQAYVVWFMFDGRTGYPLSPIFPDEDGSFSDRFAIPAAVVSLIAQTKAIEVSISSADETLKKIDKAARDRTFRIERPGSVVLRGQVPQPRQANGAQEG